MVKYYKCLFILIFVFLITGCNAEYSIEINNNEIKEKLLVLETDVNKFDSIFYNKTSSEGSEKSTSFTYMEFAKLEAKNKTFALMEEPDSSYSKRLIKDSDKLGVEFKYTFPIKKYVQSNIVNSFYNYYSLYELNNIYTLSALDASSCFEQFSMLDNVKVKIKTNHKVKESNADIIENNVYIWEITKENAKNKKIYFEFYKDKYVSNINETILKVIIILISVAFLGFIVIIILRKKANKNDRI